jgi:hypothetical protein
MADLREQRLCIKFCFKLGRTAAETHHMLKKAFADNILGQIQTYDLYKRLKNDRTSTDDDDRISAFVGLQRTIRGGLGKACLGVERLTRDFQSTNLSGVVTI